MLKIIFPFASFFLSLPAFAQEEEEEVGRGAGDSTFKIINPLNTDDILVLINSVIDTLIKFGAIIAVIMVIVAGFMYTTSAGNEKKVTTANRTILYTVIGLCVLLLSECYIRSMIACSVQWIILFAKRSFTRYTTL